MSNAPLPKPMLPHSTARLTRGPFALAVAAVYLASFVSQVLLSASVTSRLGVVPFALAQTVLIIVWVVLHRLRLHDAGRPSGTVIGIALVYALEVVLITLLAGLVIAQTSATAGGVGPGAPILNLFFILYLMSLLNGGDASLGGLQLWIVGFVVIMLVPIAIALGFSCWAATRPSAPTTPVAP